MALNKNPKVDLKLKWQRILESSLIVALVLLIVAFKFFPRLEKSEQKTIEAPQELVNIQDIDNTRQENKPPPPPKPPIPIEAPTDDVLEDLEIEETTIDMDAKIEAPPPAMEKEEEEEEEPDFFQVVEQLPEIIGGMAAIQKEIVYPEIAKRAGVEGTVHVTAFIDKKGNVVKVELLKGIGAGCDEEAKKAVMKAKFKPARQRGKPVNVRIGIPVKFKLQ